MRRAVLAFSLIVVASSLGGCDQESPPIQLDDGAVPDGDAVPDADAAPDAAPDADTRELCDGIPDGYLCGLPPEGPCEVPSTCQDGECVPNFLPEGTVCGEPASECEAPSTCDGAGTCEVRFLAEGTPCGDPGETECDAPDTCDGQGTCLPRYVEAGAPCGDPSASECDHADTCDGEGVCQPNEVLDGTFCYDCPLGAGRCAACFDGACEDRDALCVGVPRTSLTTTSAAGNDHNGNMFDVVALEDVIVEGFDVHPWFGSTTIELYHRAGTWEGFASTPSAWTFLGRGPVPYGTWLMTVPVPDLAVYIPAGERHAFYVTSSDVMISLAYTNGSEIGNVYSADDSLQFLEGSALAYPFTAGSGVVFSPRVWNGRIHYSRPETFVATTAPAGTLASRASFEIEATELVRVLGLDLRLAAGTHDVEIYFRRGEASQEGEWVRLAARDGVTSTGEDALVRVPFTSGVELSAGEVITLEVALGDTPGLSVSTTEAGDELASGPRLSLHAAGPHGFRGALFGAACATP